MKKMVIALLLTGCITLMTACGSSKTEQETAGYSEIPQITVSETEEPQEETEPIQEEESEMRVRLTFDGGEAIVRLADNDAARSFYAQLPMTQTFEDFNSIEKICRLPEELVTEGVERGVDPDVADVTLYAPWNTLVFYYEDYGYNNDLISMGHVETGMELLGNMGESFSVTMEPVSEEDSATVTMITMTAGDTVITAELSDSETTRAFLETLPRTFTMNRYGNREYYGRMESISENGEVVADFENGDVTYYPAGPSFAIFFAGEEHSSQSGLIRMGKITSDLSVFDTMGDTLEVSVEISNK